MVCRKQERGNFAHLRWLCLLCSAALRCPRQVGALCLTAHSIRIVKPDDRLMSCEKVHSLYRESRKRMCRE